LERARKKTRAVNKRHIDPEAKAIGERLVSAAAAKGMKQATLARAVGVQNSVVYRHQKGHVRPGLDSAVKYAKVLDITVEWLMTGLGPGPDTSAAVMPSARLVSRGKSGDTAEVPLVVAQLYGRLPDVTIDEIAHLARLARAEPGLSVDHLELTLLSRRAIQSRAPTDADLFNAALKRQSEEKNEREIRLTENRPPPQPQSVRKARPQKRSR
jgi:DNA-binding XRE family transcriptional regulator